MIDLLIDLDKYQLFPFIDYILICFKYILPVCIVWTKICCFCLPFLSLKKPHKLSMNVSFINCPNIIFQFYIFLKTETVIRSCLCGIPWDELDRQHQVNSHYLCLVVFYVLNLNYSHSILISYTLLWQWVRNNTPSTAALWAKYRKFHVSVIFFERLNFGHRFIFCCGKHASYSPARRTIEGVVWFYLLRKYDDVP